MVADEDALFQILGVNLEVAAGDLHRATALDHFVHLQGLVVLHGEDLWLDKRELFLLHLYLALVYDNAAAERGVEAHGVARGVKHVVGVAEHAHDARADLEERGIDGASFFEEFDEQVLKFVEHALHLRVGERQAAPGHAGNNFVVRDSAHILGARCVIVWIGCQLVIHQYIFQCHVVYGC